MSAAVSNFLRITVYLVVTLCMGIDGKKNILFLVADDMRPEIGAYLGSDFPSPVHPKMHTPNLDQLASQSLLLKQAYVQQALCGPSRTSLLTGRRPDTTHVYDLRTYWRKSGGNFTTIPQFFKEHGYITQGMGKIFHPGRSSLNDDPISWTEPYFHGIVNDVYADNLSWEAVPQAKVEKYPLVDQQIAAKAIVTLKQLAPKFQKEQQNFFLAVGFHRPHLPFRFPEKFHNFYPFEDIKLPANPYIPKNFPPIAWNQCSGLANFKDIKKTSSSLAFNTTVPDATARELRRAYYSSISYTDDLIGSVLSELHRLGLANDTIVSFWGDHGWQLGEHKEWCKQTNFDLATHAPMMIHVPGVTDDGIVVEEMTEFVDLFPTLVDLTGFDPLTVCPKKSSHVTVCTEGTSLTPFMNAKSDALPWKKRVFSQFPRNIQQPDDYMGYTMRTQRYRYTEWVRFSGAPMYIIHWEHSKGTELYDHKLDPEENVNRAKDPGYRMIVRGLSSMLHQGWRSD